MRSSLKPVAAGFLLFGFYAGAFAVAAIDIERQFHLSDAQLGFLLATGIIAATGLAAVGGVITDRWGAGVTLARSLSDTFAGIAPAGVVAFIISQFAGAGAATAVARWLWPQTAAPTAS